MKTPVADLRITAGRYELDSTITSAVNISLLTYARAQDGDPIPVEAYRHGWWGDTYSDTPGDSFGSRLWTLVGLSPTEVAERAPPLISEALQWMIDDGLLTSVTPSAAVINGKAELFVELE